MDFPVTPNAYKVNNPPSDQGDSFILKIDKDLSIVISSSYIGGFTTEGEDTSRRIIRDRDNNIYITGKTRSPNFPVSHGAFDSMYEMGEAFLCKFDSNMTELLYSSFFGGPGTECVNAILLDKDRNVIIAGYCDGNDVLPITENAIQTEILAGSDNGFIAVLNLSLPPSPPSSPSFVIGDGYVNLSWLRQKYDGGLPTLGYNIYKKGPDKTFLMMGSVDKETFSFNDTSIENGNVHYYRFSAFNILGESLLSEELKVEDKLSPQITFVQTSSGPTTGDLFRIAARISDNVLVDMVYITYEINGQFIDNLTMIHETDSIFICSIDIPLNRTGSLSYSISAADPSGNWRTSDKKTFSIMDNDLPIYLLDMTPKYAITGIDLSFKVSVKDNIGMERVLIEYGFNDEERMNMPMVVVDDFYSFDIKVRDVVGIIKYRFLSSDTSGNWFNTTLGTISLQDGVSPVIKKDLSQDHASTGDEFIFKAEVEDTYGPYSVTIEHWIGTSTHKFIEMEYDGNYHAAITIPENMVGYLYYILRASDAAGNVAQTDIKTVPLMDNDPPEMKVLLGPNETFTGASCEIRASFSDNIRLDRVSVKYRFGSGNEIDGSMIERTDHYFFTVNVPTDSVEPLYFRFVILDKAGNEGNAGPITVPVIDTIPPTVEVMSPLRGQAGDIIVINYTASDNIGIINISWDGPDAVFEPESISCSFKDAGEYQFTITVKDSKGNTGSANVTIIITAQDHDSGTSLVPILIGVVLLIAAISATAVATSLFLKRKKVTEPPTEPNEKEQSN